MYICICARPSRFSSDLLKSWGGGGVWRSRAECVWRVVYYWVQCVIVRVTCGARSIHSAASTSAYKEREHLMYVESGHTAWAVCIV